MEELEDKLVNCRIGSLETMLTITANYIDVNCRIGSLEKELRFLARQADVNCRIGSLERFGLV